MQNEQNELQCTIDVIGVRARANSARPDAIKQQLADIESQIKNASGKSKEWMHFDPDGIGVFPEVISALTDAGFRIKHSCCSGILISWDRDVISDNGYNK